MDSDCQGKENKKCDPITSTCVQCVDDGDCDVLYPCTLSDGCPPQYCTANNVCSPCTIDSHCAFCPPTPSCGPISLINQARRRPRVGGARSLAQITEETVIPTTCLQCVEDEIVLNSMELETFASHHYVHSVEMIPHALKRVLSVWEGIVRSAPMERITVLKRETASQASTVPLI